ncbi:rust resistance kinase Lr10-like [Apium graveolens]|uniref:rust resistance kinase Lr10-like n=1 Tax=Apium graveolens TaxID=4045 RepID=UPI003D7B5EE0
MVKVNHALKLAVFIIVCSNIVTRLEGAGQYDECNVTRCGATEIRFPFHLKGTDDQQRKEKDHCVFPPGFQLSCNGIFPILEFEYHVNTSLSGLYLSFSVKATVDIIDYKSRQLRFISPPGDIRQHYFSHNNQSYHLSPFKPFTLSNTPSNHIRINGDYEDFTLYFNDYTFYNCSSPSEMTRYRLDNHIISSVSSLKGHDYQVYAVYSHYEIVEAPLTSCTKMYNFSNVPYNAGGLTWSGPDCSDCEAKGQYCKFKPNSTILTQCYPKGPSSHKLLLTGKVGGIIFILFALVALFYAAHSYKQNRRYHLKVETFLEDYRALKPSRYSYADLKKISNHFKVELGKGGYGSVFKGQLSNDVVVAVKVLNDKVDAEGSGEDFINEVSTIGLIHHVNVVRLVGYCADGCRRALVYEFLPNESLEKYVYSRKNKNKKFLGWEKMQNIALGIAKGVEYLHQGCAQPILHFDIKPQNILLDQNFNPKVSDFGLAKLCAKGQSIVSMTMARGTIGYIAPEVFSRNFGKVSSKSDVYSFGMLLLEMVGARDHISVSTENSSEAYFPEWVFQNLEQGRETTSQIEEINSNIARKLTIVGLWCINWHLADRPSMKQVIQMIQEEDCPAMPPNPFNSASRGNASTFSNMLEVISETE